MTYRVSLNPDGRHRWWQPGDDIPDDHRAVRDATPQEAALIDEILAQDAAGRMPDGRLGTRFAIEAAARDHYEVARRRVAGRPAWENLDPDDAYDMGMRGHAIAQARLNLARATA